jgi:hypothetical protein
MVSVSMHQIEIQCTNGLELDILPRGKSIEREELSWNQQSSLCFWADHAPSLAQSNPRASETVSFVPDQRDTDLSPGVLTQQRSTLRS